MINVTLRADSQPTPFLYEPRESRLQREILEGSGHLHRAGARSRANAARSPSCPCGCRYTIPGGFEACSLHATLGYGRGTILPRCIDTSVPFTLPIGRPSSRSEPRKGKTATLHASSRLAYSLAPDTERARRDLERKIRSHRRHQLRPFLRFDPDSNNGNLAFGCEGPALSDPANPCDCGQYSFKWLKAFSKVMDDDFTPDDTLRVSAGPASRMIQRSRSSILAARRKAQDAGPRSFALWSPMTPDSVKTKRQMCQETSFLALQREAQDLLSGPVDAGAWKKQRRTSPRQCKVYDIQT